MKNALGIFKKTFQKLLTKFDLHLSFVLDAFVFLLFLTYPFLSQIESNVQRLM